MHYGGQAPGSPESQEALQVIRKEVQAVLDQPRQQAFVAWPLCHAGHWALLLVTRQAAREGQEQPDKPQLRYQDSLTRPSERCRKQAQVAVSIAREAFGQEQFAQRSLPEPAPSAKQAVQAVATSC